MSLSFKNGSHTYNINVLFELFGVQLCGVQGIHTAVSHHHHLFAEHHPTPEPLFTAGWLLPALLPGTHHCAFYRNLMTPETHEWTQTAFIFLFLARVTYNVLKVYPCASMCHPFLPLEG